MKQFKMKLFFLFRSCTEKPASKFFVINCRVLQLLRSLSYICLGSWIVNTPSWFTHIGMKSNPEKYQAMVPGKTEDRVNFQFVNVNI